MKELLWLTILQALVVDASPHPHRRRDNSDACTSVVVTETKTVTPTILQTMATPTSNSETIFTSEASFLDTIDEFSLFKIISDIALGNML